MAYSELVIGKTPHLKEIPNICKVPSPQSAFSRHKVYPRLLGKLHQKLSLTYSAMHQLPPGILLVFPLLGLQKRNWESE